MRLDLISLLVLLIAGMAVVQLGTSESVVAQTSGNPGTQPSPGTNPARGMQVDKPIVFGLCQVLSLPEGAWGALVLAVAGVIALISAALGAYRAALSLVVVATGAWLIRPLIFLFFGSLDCGSYTFVPRAPIR